MKITYLVLAHNNFEHLDRLLASLDVNDCSFYIHIDKKTKDIYTPKKSNTHIIPQHIDIKWGGYSMIEATLALLNNAIKGEPDSNYYILISGADYPIRPQSFLDNLLSKGKEYIDIAPLPVPHKPMERYEYYHFDYERRNYKVYNPLFILEKGMKRLKIKRKAPFKLFVGSQWFALTKNCVHYILDTVRKDQSYEKFFRHTLVPDEAFFQTIIGNSLFASQTRANLVYTDWEVAIPPAIIEDRHIDLLKNKMEWNDEYGKRFPYFARKFTNNSQTITNKIEEELRK